VRTCGGTWSRYLHRPRPLDLTTPAGAADDRLLRRRAGSARPCTLHALLLTLEVRREETSIRAGAICARERSSNWTSRAKHADNLGAPPIRTMAGHRLGDDPARHTVKPPQPKRLSGRCVSTRVATSGAYCSRTGPRAAPLAISLRLATPRLPASRFLPATCRLCHGVKRTLHGLLPPACGFLSCASRISSTVLPRASLTSAPAVAAYDAGANAAIWS